MTALRYGISDALVLARRSFLRIPRQPDLLVGFTIQPVMFVLLFVYVLGGAISTPGFDYVDFLMPGIIVQSMAFGGFVTALGLAEDLKKGLIDRFRSLRWPGPRSSRGARSPTSPPTSGYSSWSCWPSGSPWVPVLDQRPRGRRRHRAPAPDRLRLLAGLRVHRADLVLARGRERLRLHHHLPAHLRLVGLRPGRLDAELASPSPSTSRSRRWSTPPAAFSSGRRPETTSGCRSSGRSGSSSSSACSPRGATGAR